MFLICKLDSIIYIHSDVDFVLLTIISIDETEPIYYHIISHHYHYSPEALHCFTHLHHNYQSAPWHSNHLLQLVYGFCRFWWVSPLLSCTWTLHKNMLIHVTTCLLLTTYHCWEIHVQTCLAALAFVNWLLCNSWIL